MDTTARWRIADAKKFLENVATEAGARSRLDDIIDSVVRDQVFASKLVELVRSASWEANIDRSSYSPSTIVPLFARSAPLRWGVRTG